MKKVPIKHLTHLKKWQLCIIFGKMLSQFSGSGFFFHLVIILTEYYFLTMDCEMPKENGKITKILPKLMYNLNDFAWEVKPSSALFAQILIWLDVPLMKATEKPHFLWLACPESFLLAQHMHFTHGHGEKGRRGENSRKKWNHKGKFKFGIINKKSVEGSLIIIFSTANPFWIWSFLGWKKMKNVFKGSEIAILD